MMPWHHKAWDSLRGRLARDAFPHAVLLAGARGLGKRDFARQLAAAVLCPERHEGAACQQCKSCQLIRAGTHPDYHVLQRGESSKGKLRKEIVVDQVREMSRQLAMTSQLGGNQIVVIDPADKLNHAAANALLKTLEEPARDTVLLLVADEPWRLPATVRSRCQTFALQRPSRLAALSWLEQQGMEQAEDALDIAGGNPGLAWQWAQEGVLDVHKEVVADLDNLALGGASVDAIVTRWCEGQTEDRLWFAARHAADCARALACEPYTAVDRPVRELALLDWYRKALRAREDLDGPLRPELVLIPLLTAWRGCRQSAG